MSVACSGAEFYLFTLHYITDFYLGCNEHMCTVTHNKAIETKMVDRNMVDSNRVHSIPKYLQGIRIALYI